ncbi:hypothetical protein AcV7_000053 [Taiwanofungus camphoratus]|nr:hypothetical protein AcV7_000053 [Antrodia cinnamomea]
MPALHITPLAALRTSTYEIPPHAHVPNTSLHNHPLLIYHVVFPPSSSSSQIESHLSHVGVVVPQWRYSMYRQSHFHSTTHELLVVSAGRARLLFGGDGNPSGVHVEVGKGDAMLVPAGVAHRLVEDMEGEGNAFEMVGSYPVKAAHWDMCYGREGEDHKGIEERIFALGWFSQDPIYGAEGPAPKY